MQELVDNVFLGEKTGLEEEDSESQVLASDEELEELPTTFEALKALNFRQRHFVNRLLINKGMQRKSAREAGYHENYCHDLISLPKVRTALLCRLRDHYSEQEINRVTIRQNISAIGNLAVEAGNHANALRAQEMLGRSELEGSIFSERLLHGVQSHEDYVQQLANRGGEADGKED